MIDFTNGNYIKLGPASERDVQDVQKLLVPSETILACFKNVRDYCVFTNKRLITVNVQGMTGKKRDYTSLPYSKISAFSIETAGHFDFDSELELWFSGLGQVNLEFTGSTDITGLARIIASNTL